MTRAMSVFIGPNVGVDRIDPDVKRVVRHHSLPKINTVKEDDIREEATRRLVAAVMKFEPFETTINFEFRAPTGVATIRTAPDLMQNRVLIMYKGPGMPQEITAATVYDKKIEFEKEAPYWIVYETVENFEYYFIYNSIAGIQKRPYNLHEYIENMVLADGRHVYEYVEPLHLTRNAWVSKEQHAGLHEDHASDRAYNGLTDEADMIAADPEFWNEQQLRELDNLPDKGWSRVFTSRHRAAG